MLAQHFMSLFQLHWLPQLSELFIAKSLICQPMKKSATDFVDDLLDGSFPRPPIGLSQQEAMSALASQIDAAYSFTQEELELAMQQSKVRLEDAIGVALTDEQLAALSGGKSESAKIGSYVGGAIGGAAAAGAIGGGIAGGVIAALAFIAIK